MAPSIASERHPFVHNGQTVYEWQQSFGGVEIFIRVPQGVRAKQLEVVITGSHLTVGIKGNPPYLDVRGAACRGGTAAGPAGARAGRGAALLAGADGGGGAGAGGGGRGAHGRRAELPPPRAGRRGIRGGADPRLIPSSEVTEVAG